MCRSLAAVIVQAMADTDTNFTTMAFRIGQKESTVRRWLEKLIDGEDDGLALNNLSDMTLAMGCEIDFSVRPKEETKGASQNL
jgi:hypothetical protein